MVALRAGEFAEPNGHHLEKAALDFPVEIGMPLDAPYQHDTVGFVGRLVHEGFDAVGSLAQRHHVEMAHQGASHGRLGDVVVRQHFGLPFRAGRAVATHRRENKRAHALVLPIPHHAAHDGGDVMDAPAADADSDSGPGRHTGGKAGRDELLFNFGRNIENAAVGKFLAGNQQAGKSHKFYSTRTLSSGAQSKEQLSAGSPRVTRRSGTRRQIFHHGATETLRKT
jgi:hypothetical protein